MATKKSGSIGFRPKLVSLAVASCFATSTALANPTGAQVVNGQASIIQNGALLQITNTPNAIINWQSFSIGASEITKFIQQSQASAVLNRVIGNGSAIDPSVILGALQSNGRVFLVNPSGIVFGAASQVDVAGLVATSLNISNSDFLAGKLKFTDGATAGSVVNQGNINANGGEVYLVGNAVTNNGIIKSPNGDVVLAAGNSVELVSPGTPNLRVEITAPTNEAKNLGQIVVDSGRAGIYAGLVNNSGTIRADSVVAEGGKILLKATKSTTLEDTSVLSAQGVGGGEIKVLAGDQVNVAGKLDASAPISGDGGFIETSAASVKIADGTFVTTSAPLGKSGMWLIDPNDFFIGSGTCPSATCDITGTQLGLNLGSTDVTITSDQGGTASASGNGDIFVNDAVNWSAATTLTLTAHGSVDVNAPISNTGNGNLAIYAGWDGSGGISQFPTLSSLNAPSGISHIYLPAPITMNQSSVTGGKVILAASGDIEQDLPSGNPITASSLFAQSTNGDVILNDPGNAVKTLAGGAKNQFQFTNNQSLTIGSFNTGNSNLGSSGTVGGILASGQSPANVQITVASGDLTVSNNVRAFAGSSNSANITLNAAHGSITVNNGATVLAHGGNGDSGGGASVSLIAGTTIDVNGSTVQALGGAGTCCSGGGAAMVQLTAPGGITVENHSLVNATGGRGGSIELNSGSGRGGWAIVSLWSSGGQILVDTNSSITASGGKAGRTGGSGGQANINFDSSVTGTAIKVTGNSTVQATGGDGAEGGPGRVNLNAYSGDIQLDAGSSLTALGGNGIFRNNIDNLFGGSAGVNLNAGGKVTVSGVIVATGGKGAANSFTSGNANAKGGDATVSITAGTGITVSSTGSITATGGNGGSSVHASASECFSCGQVDVSGGAASVTLTSTTGGIDVSGAISAKGGSGGINASSSGGAFARGNFVTANANGGDGSVTLLSTAGGITVSGSIGARGGNGGLAFASASSASARARGGNATVQLTAATDTVTGKSIAVTGPISVRGGNGGSAFASGSSYAGASARGGSATVKLSSSTGAPIEAAGIAVNGGNGGFAGNSFFGSPGFGSHTADGGNATVLLSNTGSITVSGAGITASGGSGGFGGPRTGGAATIVLAQVTTACESGICIVGPAGDITIGGNLLATGGSGISGGRGGQAAVGLIGNSITVNNSTVRAQGGTTFPTGGSGGVFFESVTSITSNNSSIEAYGGPFSQANTSLSALGGDITINGGDVEAEVGTSLTGPAVVSMSTPGSITVGGAINTAGVGTSTETPSSGIYLTAGNAIIGAGGTLTQSTLTGSQQIVLQAANGIGSLAAPILIGTNNFSLVSANNSAAGDLALEFAGTGGLNLGGATNIFNGNPTGTYFIQNDNGSVGVTAPFMPGGSSSPGAGQTVHLRAPTSSIGVSFGAGTGSISAGQIVLEALTGIEVEPDGPSINSAGNVILRANDMDIRGPVTAGNNIYVTPFTQGTAIELGTVGSPGGVLALDPSELTMLSALGLGIGSDGTTANTGPITFTAAVGPFSAFPNLFGSNITQNSGGSLNSPGGLNAFATGNILLTDPGNSFGSFGGTSGGNLSLFTTSNIGLGALTATGTASVTSSGGAIFNFGGGTITAPTVQLMAVNGIGQSVAPIFLPTATGVTANNSASGDIVLSQASGNFTIGGNWIVSNSGGSNVIGGNTVTLNSSTPGVGSMFVGANDIIVGPSGYTNSGIVALTALNNVNVNGNLTASDLALFGGNQVNINGATASGTNSASVLATTLNLTAGSAPARLKAGTALGVAAGEINVTGGSGTNAFAEMSVGPAGTMDVFTVVSPISTGNINLKGGTGSGAYARIFGDPDVGNLLLPVEVDGVIKMTDGTGSGAYARIESASVNSIHVDFTHVASGGYFVNGVEGTVSSGSSGFFAGGQPAIIDQNFFVTYGGGTVVPAILPAGVQQAIDQIAVVTNQQTTITQDAGHTSDNDKEGGNGNGLTPEEKKRKSLPICGK